MNWMAKALTSGEPDNVASSSQPVDVEDIVLPPNFERLCWASETGNNGGGSNSFNPNVRIRQADFQRHLNEIMQNSALGTMPLQAGSKQANEMLISQAKMCSAEHLNKYNVVVRSKSGKGRNIGKPQKNDKSVEVYFERRVVARFRTQTDCARYLRATPEAVSYHCSKGGGLCNGLGIKPVHEPKDGSPMAYGLFEGSAQCRPKERPQLKPETVSILKDWLLDPEHMDNPYPNQPETEKLMKKTGLDKIQLKHWFNNARKRILKPLLKNGGKEACARYQMESKKRGSACSVSDNTLDGSKRRKRGSADSSASTLLASANAVKQEECSHPLGVMTRMPSNISAISHDSYSGEQSRTHSGSGSSMFSSSYNSFGCDGSSFHDSYNSMQQQRRQFCPNDSFSPRSDSYQDWGCSRNFGQVSDNFNQGPQDRDSSHCGNDDNARSNAIFKQQVANMAMSEASSAFTEMEAAFQRAKELKSQASNPDDDLACQEASAHAKKCQSTAMFKLKVSQKASDEASNAFELYQKTLARNLL
ncbi:hypothetical protein THAOC_17022 [Thalassiosira oceanica]|uniref:Homeobox domain-containing protein n=1 Tax=Thalassiosira oceanica TaxID=159749 RepID=K0SBP5_THAOC|nr:hypothetical protein THAOC_17022 [Thalassiosira oceanica]|eukprot:EJK62369.1 hypothetical protein THAOC_17022 [Thalassiosira oceanica]